MIIVNADDFGYSKTVNRAIVDTFQKGICSSSTIMANAKHFDEACQLAHDNKLTKQIGIHMVLIEEQPITENIKKCPLLVLFRKISDRKSIGK